MSNNHLNHSILATSHSVSNPTKLLGVIGGLNKYYYKWNDYYKHSRTIKCSEARFYDRYKTDR